MNGACPSPDDGGASASANTRGLAKTLSANFYRVVSNGHDDALKASAEANFRIKFDQSVFDNSGGGADYPIYPVRMCVNLQSLDKAESLIANSGKQPLRSASGTAQPNPTDPALIEAR
jgi:hypothetical protein